MDFTFERLKRSHYKVMSKNANTVSSDKITRRKIARDSRFLIVFYSKRVDFQVRRTSDILRDLSEYSLNSGIIHSRHTSLGNYCACATDLHRNLESHFKGVLTFFADFRTPSILIHIPIILLWGHIFALFAFLRLSSASSRASIIE